jgi:hypothetical protein
MSMPRSIQEILDQADELAKRFEDYEPGEGDQVPVEVYLLRRAALARARSEREVVDAVTSARSSGISWNKIGEILGTSAQAAQQRYAAVVERPNCTHPEGETTAHEVPVCAVPERIVIQR